MKKVKDEIKQIETNVISIKLTARERVALKKAVDILKNIDSYVIDPQDIIKIDSDIFESCKGEDITTAKCILEGLLLL